MDVHISLVGRRDLTGEVYRQLRAAIMEGRFREGEALPPSRELAARLSVSRTTITVAYDRLISEGFATARMGSGTYVSRGLSGGRDQKQTRGSGLRARRIWAAIPAPTAWAPAEFDFRPGIPDARLFPYEPWRRLMSREFRPGAGSLAYGDPAGHAGLREAIVQHIGISRGINADAADVIITNGTQQAIDLIARVLVGPGDRVAVEDPGYGPPRRLLTSLGLAIAGVPVDDEGLIVDAIPPQTMLVYVSPSHQFPLGMSMSLRRRMALLAWANRTGGAIIEDDYDSEFRFGGRPLEPLHKLDADGRVIYVGSFSKTMLPTLRLGFLVAPPTLHSALVAAKYVADWHSPLAVQATMARFIADGLFARHVRRMRTTYEERHAQIIDILARTFADNLTVVPSSVGLHLAALGRGVSVDQIDAVVRRASSVAVACLPLSMFAAGETARAGLVLGYGAIAGPQIPAGLSRLRRCFELGGQGSVRRAAAGLPD
jgi:GntR family transcriptional regulator/MocR family aminotransferase